MHSVAASVRDRVQVVNLDKLDYCSSMKNNAAIQDSAQYTFVRGNILSSSLLEYIIKTERIDTIIHAAAHTHVDNSFGNSYAFTENNVCLSVCTVVVTHCLCVSARTAPG